MLFFTTNQNNVMKSIQGIQALSWYNSIVANSHITGISNCCSSLLCVWSLIKRSKMVSNQTKSNALSVKFLIEPEPGIWFLRMPITYSHCLYSLFLFWLIFVLLTQKSSWMQNLEPKILIWIKFSRPSISENLLYIALWFHYLFYLFILIHLM